MEIGARNRLDGEVSEIKRGTVMCQVRVNVAGGAQMESVMTLDSLDDLAGKRIATSYVGVVRRHLEERGVDAEVIRLDGAVETSIQLGVAASVSE